MSFEGLLVQIVLFSCLAMLIQARQIARGYGIAAVFNLALLLALLWQFPHWAGWLSGTVWAMTFLLPLLVSARLRFLMLREEYQGAARLVRRWPWLGPWGGYFAQPALVEGLAIAQAGDLETALQHLGRDRNQPGSPGQIANTIFYQLSAQWPELLAWMQINFTESQWTQVPILVAIAHVRALGETHHREAMVRAFAKLNQTEAFQRDRDSLNHLRMIVAAFCGKTILVQQLLSTTLKLSEPSQQFWRATALLAQKHQAERRQGSQQLETLQQSGSGIWQGAIAYRLQHPPPATTASLSPSAAQILQQLETEVQNDLKAGPLPFARQQQRAWLTYGLIGLNCAVFLAEIGAEIGAKIGAEWVSPFLGSSYTTTLFLSGALVPSRVLAGEWWRLGSAIFLHANFVHLFSNMLGLFFYGSFVESRLGGLKLGFVYGIAGIGSMVGMMAVALIQGEPELYGIGASGAVMGLLGVMVAIGLKGWQASKSVLAGRNLRLLVILIVLQTLSDFAIPQVSASAHLSGLAIGFLLGLSL